MTSLLIIANILCFGSFFLRFSTMPPQVPLFYTRLGGEEQLVDTWAIFILPIIMNVLFIVNNRIQKKYFKDNDFISRIFYSLNIFIIIVLTFIFIKVIFLIT